MARSKTRIGGLLAVICVLALLVAGATPAFAHHKDGHEQGDGQEENFQEADHQASDHDGDADSDSSSTQTEDDSDPRESDPEGQADEGDNQHPSGKDRSVENGKSKSNPNQGKAESNPDDSKGPQRWEGDAQEDDKPNALGGEDAADQDGNNGCGNDDDFDDDNNGHCGKSRPTSAPSPSPSPSPTVIVNMCPTNPSLPMGHEDCDKVKSDGGPKMCPTNPSLPMGHKDCLPPTRPCDADSTMPGIQPCVNATVVCPAGTDNAGREMADLDDCNEDVDATVVCPAGTDNAGLEMADLDDCNEDDVEGRTDQANPVKVCPAGGPYAGMPFMDADDCGSDRVSPSRIVRSAVAAAGDSVLGAARAAGAAAGAALPFTGAGDLLLIAGIAVLLIAGGTFAQRTRGTK